MRDRTLPAELDPQKLAEAALGLLALTVHRANEFLLQHVGRNPERDA